MGLIGSTTRIGMKLDFRGTREVMRISHDAPRIALVPKKQFGRTSTTMRETAIRIWLLIAWTMPHCIKLDPMHVTRTGCMILNFGQHLRAVTASRKKKWTDDGGDTCMPHAFSTSFQFHLFPNNQTMSIRSFFTLSNKLPSNNELTSMKASAAI